VAFVVYGKWQVEGADFHFVSSKGRVEDAYFSETAPYTPGLVELIRWRLGRLKKGWLPWA
jgi:hypothetical protein